MRFRGGGQTQNLSAVKKHAFTLAEVLITLGIIGVVAAMTLPALVQNYNKKIFETAFKKSVNTVLNTNKMLLAQKEQFSLCDLEYFDCGSNLFEGIDIKDGSMDSYMKSLGFQKKKANLGNISEFLGSDYIYASKDGACYAVANLFTTAGDAEKTFELFVDTNCSKNPNKGGRDQFFIVFDDKLTLETDIDHTQDVEDMCKELVKTVSSDSASSAAAYASVYCGAYMIENGYNMDY